MCTTVHAFHQSKSIKLFIVIFLNTFWPFFYTAFVRPWLRPRSCGVDHCQELLRTNIVITYVTYASFGILDMLLPLISYTVRTGREARAFKKKGGQSYVLSSVEAEAKMDEYDGDVETYDYFQIVFPLAFIIFFSMIGPMCLIMALVEVSLQIRADATKLVFFYRRPLPHNVLGIGNWNKVSTSGKGG